MSQEHQSHEAHGSMSSYIVGFILSLIFTAIPYYLVVHHTLSRGLLLQVILGCAVFQMLIQVLFFLHLGRGPKPLYNVSFFVATVGLILVVVVGSIFIMNNLHYNMSPGDVTKKLAQDENIAQVGGELTGACRITKENHRVTIAKGRVNPVHVEANICDTLSFINQDEAIRDITFASPLEPITAYAGETDLIVRKGYGKTITLNQSGNYLFRDDFDHNVTGDFTVNP